MEDCAEADFVDKHDINVPDPVIVETDKNLNIIKSIKEESVSKQNCDADNFTNMESEEFAYTKAERFTSEVFKIEVGNLPKFFGFGNKANKNL